MFICSIFAKSSQSAKCLMATEAGWKWRTQAGRGRGGDMLAFAPAALTADEAGQFGNPGPSRSRSLSQHLELLSPLLVTGISVICPIVAKRRFARFAPIQAQISRQFVR
jgi:hypothetical protein